MSPRRVAFLGIRNFDRSIASVALHYAAKCVEGPELFVVGAEGEPPPYAKTIGSLREIPQGPDAVVVSVRSAAIAGAIEASAAAGAKLAVIVSVPTSAQDRDAIMRGIQAARETSPLRVIGPGSAGMFSRSAYLSISSLLANRRLRPGGVALVGQSGGLLGMVGNAVLQMGGGLAAFVSTGEELDMTGPEVAALLLEQDDVDCVGLYIEAFTGLDAARGLADVASRTGKRVIVLKGGRSGAALEAVQSHSRRLSSGGAAYDGLFDALGFHVVRTPDALALGLAVASQLRRRPAPAHASVGIVTDSGGMGVLAMDALEDAGVHLPSFAGLASRFPKLPARVQLANPLDISGADVGRDNANVLCASIAAIGESGLADVTLVQSVSRKINNTAGEIAASRPAQGALLVCPLTISHPLAEDARKLLHEADILTADCSVTEIADAVRAAASAPRPARAEPLAAVAAQMWQPLPTGEYEIKKALQARFGLNVPTGFKLAAGDTAALEQVQLRYPAVLKRLTNEPRHKAASGGVRVGLRGKPELQVAFAEMSAGAGEGAALLLEEMAFGTCEILFSIVKLPDIGTVAIVGLGGTATELAGAVRHLPAFAGPALLEEVLAGFVAGAPASSLAPLVRGLTALLAAVDASPAILQLELNPIIVGPGGHAVADAKIWIQ